MPPKKERLTKKDFATLGRKSTLRGSFFDLAYVPATSPKVACIISVKRVKRAVDRNRIRRKLYRAWSLLAPHKPYYVIMYPQANAVTTPLVTLREALSRALAELG